jgi:hypothetical protein
MSDLRTESRALFRAARQELEPSEADRSRVGRALVERLGPAAGIVVVGSVAAKSAMAVQKAASGAAPAAGRSAAVAVTKWFGKLLLASAVGAGGVAGYSMMRSDPRLSHAHADGVGPVPGPSASAVAPSATAPAARPIAAPPVPRTQSPHSMLRRSAPSGTVAEEARILRLAEDALRGGDASRAMGLLEEHARTFPDGILVEERLAERVAALCMLGRVAEAREESRRFLRAFPGSPLAEGVRTSCGTSEGSRPRESFP